MIKKTQKICFDQLCPFKSVEVLDTVRKDVSEVAQSVKVKVV